MTYQGTFTPTTSETDDATVPVPIAGPGCNYQHGMSWLADADGYLLGEEVREFDTVFASHWQDTVSSTICPEAITWDLRSADDPLSFGCDELVVRLNLEDAENPNWTGLALWDQAEWDNVDPPSNAIWGGSFHGWTDITSYVRDVDLKRGRATQWNDIITSECRVSVNNASGFFSAYSSQGNPRFGLFTEFYLGAKWRGVEYPLFVGGLIEFNEDDLPGQDGATFLVADATYSLTSEMKAEYNPGDRDDVADTRIMKLLTLGDITQARHIQSGTSRILNYKTLRNLLSEIKLTATADGGLFFVDNDGTITYLNRSRLNGRDDAARIPYFSDSCDEMTFPYAAVEASWNDVEFGNVVVVRNVSQDNKTEHAALAVDSASVDRYGRQGWSPRQLSVAAADDLQGLADWELSRRSQAWYRVNKIEVFPAHDSRMWPYILGLRLNDPVIVERTPPGNTTPIIAQFILDGYQMEGTPELMKFTLFFSPAINIFGRTYGSGTYGSGTYGRSEDEVVSMEGF